jgi:hypothetical protein
MDSQYGACLKRRSFLILFLNALIAATPVVGRDKNERPALYDLLQKHTISLK